MAVICKFPTGDNTKAYLYKDGQQMLSFIQPNFYYNTTAFNTNKAVTWNTDSILFDISMSSSGSLVASCIATRDKIVFSKYKTLNMHVKSIYDTSYNINNSHICSMRLFVSDRRGNYYNTAAITYINIENQNNSFTISLDVVVPNFAYVPEVSKSYFNTSL